MANRPAPKKGNSFAEHATAFNSKIRILVRDVARQYPNDPTIHRARTRAMTVIDLDPLFVIESVGPYLYTYREQVYALEGKGSTEEFFLERSYDTELKASVDQEKADLVQYIIPKAKECARALTPDRKREYIELIVGLLDEYIEYLAAKKRLDDKK